MSRTKTAYRAVLGVAAGLVLAAPVYAQDAPPPAKPGDAAAPAGTTAPKTAPKTAKTVTTAAPTAPDRDEAVKTAPTYDAFGASDTASSADTMKRVARDFAVTSELGVKRLGSVPMWPRGDLKIGPVRILPYLREGVEYESNFFHQRATGTYGRPNAHDAVWTHQNQAGFTADAALAGGRLKLALSLDAEYSARYGQDGGDVDPTGLYEIPGSADNDFQIDSQLAASYRWPQGVYVRAGIRYEKLSDPVDVAYSTRYKRANTHTFITAGMDKDILFGSKFRFEAGMNTLDVASHEKGLDNADRTETDYYLKASYPFWKEQTRLYVKADYRQDERESDQLNDGYNLGFEVGMEGSISLGEGESRGLRGRVGIGFDSALYENGNFSQGTASYIRDENRRNTNLSINVLLQYMMSSKSTIDLRWYRGNQFSFHGNLQTTDRVDLTFTHEIRRGLTGRIGTFFEYDDPSGRLSPQDTAAATDSTGEYPATTRFGAGVGLRYRLNDWADLDGSFDWERRNNRVNGYVNHRASVGVTVYLAALKARPRAGDQQ